MAEAAQDAADVGGVLAEAARPFRRRHEECRLLGLEAGSFDELEEVA
jgi:hypothetical protein